MMSWLAGSSSGGPCNEWGSADIRQCASGTSSGNCVVEETRSSVSRQQVVCAVGRPSSSAGVVQANAASHGRRAWIDCPGLVNRRMAGGAAG